MTQQPKPRIVRIIEIVEEISGDTTTIFAEAETDAGDRLTLEPIRYASRPDVARFNRANAYDELFAKIGGRAPWLTVEAAKRASKEAGCNGEHPPPACGDVHCWHGAGTPETRAFQDDELREQALMKRTVVTDPDRIERMKSAVVGRELPDRSDDDGKYTRSPWPEVDPREED